MPVIGAPTTRNHIPNLLEANLRKAYLDTTQRLTRKSYYRQVFNMHTTDIKIERDAVVAGYGLYTQKAEGSAPDYDSGQEAWTKTYTPVTFCLGVQVTKEALEDDLHGVVKHLTSMGGPLAQVAEYTKENTAVDLFNTTLTSGTVYTADSTNYALLSTSHFLVTGGTWSNRPANDLDLSIEALEFAYSHWVANQVNQRGQKLMTGPKTLMIGPADWALARRLVGTRGRRPQSADNDINAVDDLDLSDLMHPLLTNDGRWLLFAPKEDHMMNYFDRVKPNVERWPDADNGNLRYVGRYRAISGATGVSGVWGSA